MKSEQRHKLQENVLAKWLSDVGEAVQPYANAILAVVLLAVVLFGLWKWWQQQSAYAAANAWEDLFAAVNSQDPAALDRIVEEHQGTEVAHWAAVLAGDIHLANGCEELFSNKATASQELRKAVEKYMLVRSESRTPILRQRATYGLARAHEALAGTRQSGDELNKAIELYEEVAENWPEGMFAQAAKQRLEDLKRPATKSFYDKFAQFDPKPAFTPPDGPEKPLFDGGGLPTDGSALDVSKLLDEGAGAKPVKTGPVDLGPPLDEKPATPSADGEDPAPSSAEEKPAPAPADEKPAEKEPAEAAADAPR